MIYSCQRSLIWLIYRSVQLEFKIDFVGSCWENRANVVLTVIWSAQRELSCLKFQFRWIFFVCIFGQRLRLCEFVDMNKRNQVSAKRCRVAWLAFICLDVLVFQCLCPQTERYLSKRAKRTFRFVFFLWCLKNPPQCSMQWLILDDCIWKYIKKNS